MMDLSRVKTQMKWPLLVDGRTYAEGKKITWKDGLKAIWCVLRYNLFIIKGATSAYRAKGLYAHS